MIFQTHKANKTQQRNKTSHRFYRIYIRNGLLETFRVIKINWWLIWLIFIATKKTTSLFLIHRQMAPWCFFVFSLIDWPCLFVASFFFAISELFYFLFKKWKQQKNCNPIPRTPNTSKNNDVAKKKKTLARLEINFPTHQFTSSQQYIDLVWENSSKSDLLQKVCDPIDTKLSVLGG
jgi:hypothetical protein